MSEPIGLNIVSGDQSLSASLTLPAGIRVRGGLIPVHPASDGSRDQFLFRHLADALEPQGVAVLTYDRRTFPQGGSVPLETQALDALAAIQCLRQRLGGVDVPIGLWGYSQGAWAAPLAASRFSGVAFLILCASTGVSPAVQMRYGTARQLRLAAFGEEEIAALLQLRTAVEEYLRGRLARENAQDLLDRAAREPWFTLAWVRRVLPEPGAWIDMDFNPELVFERVHCPVLLFYGEDDEWQPIDESIATWERAASRSGNRDITIVRLPGTGHEPTIGGHDVASISPLYTQTLRSWLERRISVLERG